MPGFSDNEKSLAYFESLNEASIAAEKELKRTRAKRGGQISESAVDQVLDKVFDPILEEYEDLGDEVLLPELTKITEKIRNVFLGVSSNTVEPLQKEAEKEEGEKIDFVENKKLTALSDNWVKVREKFTETKSKVEKGNKKAAALKAQIDSLNKAATKFLKEYEDVYNALIKQNDEESLKNIIFSQAKPEISSFLIEIKRWLKFLESDKRELWMVELDEIWASINKKPDQRSTGEVLKEEVDTMRKILPDSLTKKEREFFEKAILIRDVALMETKSEGAGRHMCWQKAKEDRLKIMPYIKTNEIREDFIESKFCEFAPKEVFTYLRNVVFGFHPEEDDDIIGALNRDKVSKWNANHLDNPQTYDKKKAHNYAKLGNPDVGQIGWIPTVQEILLKKFPTLKELPDFVLESIFLSITVTEMRMEGFYPLYDAYIASPITHIDVEALFPWGAVGLIDYKAGGYGGIPGYLGLFAAMKWPSVDELKEKPKEENIKAANMANFKKGYEYAEIGSRFEENDWCSFSNENSVFQKLTAFSDLNQYIDKDWWKNEGMKVLNYGNDATRRGKAIENRAKAVIVRNYIRLMLSPAAGYDFVSINEDMKILPSPYDAFMGSFRGKDFKMSLPDLLNIYDKFDEFVKKVGDGPGKKFDSVEGIMKDLSEVVGIVAKFKQMSKVGEDESKLVVAENARAGESNGLNESIFKDFLKLTNVLLSIYIRKLYMNFLELSPEKKKDYYKRESEILVKQNILTTGLEKTKYSMESDRLKFLNRAIDLIKSATTLPISIQLYFTAETDQEIAKRDEILGKPKIIAGTKYNKESHMGILIQGKKNNQRWGRFFNTTDNEYKLHNWQMFKLFKIYFPEMVSFVSKWVNPPENVKDKKE